MTTVSKELFIRFTVLIVRERLSICVCPSCPFGFEGGVWDLIVFNPDYCLSIYLSEFKIKRLP